VVASIALVVVLDLGLVGAMAATSLGPITTSLLLASVGAFPRRALLNVDWQLLRQLLSLGSVYALALVVINLNYRLDVIILDHLSSDFQLGIYSKAVSPVEYLWEIPMLLSTIIFARS